MSINVNIEVARAVPQVNNEALTLVIFKNALAKTTNTENPVRINTLEELKAAFQLPTTIVEFRELYAAEYLIRSGVNLLCYTVDAPGTIASGDITNISDLEILDYKFIVVPYSFVSYNSELEEDNTVWDDELQSLADDNDIELLLDFDPLITTADAALAAADANMPDSAKISLHINSGFMGFSSQFTLPTGLTTTTEAKITDTTAPITYTAASDFVGIPASLLVLARKAKLISLETPWIPVAGETFGTVNEITTVFRKLSTAEKEAFQALNVNVLINRVGVGNLFVSQNTMYDTEDSTAALLRSHVVTQALWIKRQLEVIAKSAMFLPNARKTWDAISLKIKSVLRPIEDQEGISDIGVYIGRGITMSEADILAGILKVSVTYKPVRVIESITFNITIKEAEDTYEVILAGGEL